MINKFNDQLNFDLIFFILSFNKIKNEFKFK